MYVKSLSVCVCVCALTAPSIDCGDMFVQEQMDKAVIKFDLNANLCCGVIAMLWDIMFVHYVLQTVWNFWKVLKTQTQPA